MPYRKNIFTGSNYVVPCDPSKRSKCVEKIFVLEFTQTTSSDGIQCHSMGNHLLPSPVEWKEYCDAYTYLSIVCVALENTQRVTMIYCREPGYHDAVFQGMITKEYGELFKLENP